MGHPKHIQESKILISSSKYTLPIKMTNPTSHKHEQHGHKHNPVHQHKHEHVLKETAQMNSHNVERSHKHGHGHHDANWKKDYTVEKSTGKEYFNGNGFTENIQKDMNQMNGDEKVQFGMDAHKDMRKHTAHSNTTAASHEKHHDMQNEPESTNVETGMAL